METDLVTGWLKARNCISLQSLWNGSYSFFSFCTVIYFPVKQNTWAVNSNTRESHPILCIWMDNDKTLLSLLDQEDEGEMHELDLSNIVLVIKTKVLFFSFIWLSFYLVLHKKKRRFFFSFWLKLVKYFHFIFEDFHICSEWWILLFSDS